MKAIAFLFAVLSLGALVGLAGSDTVRQQFAGALAGAKAPAGAPRPAAAPAPVAALDRLVQGHVAALAAVAAEDAPAGAMNTGRAGDGSGQADRAVGEHYGKSARPVVGASRSPATRATHATRATGHALAKAAPAPHGAKAAGPAPRQGCVTAGCRVTAPMVRAAYLPTPPARAVYARAPSSG